MVEVPDWAKESAKNETAPAWVAGDAAPDWAKDTKPKANMGTGPGGEPIPADIEALKSQIDVSSGILSGIVQPFVGAAQTVSDYARGATPIGRQLEKGMPITPQQAKAQPEKFTEWAKTLKEIGDPTAQKVGQMIGETGMLMVGGEALAAPKLGAKLAPYVEKVSPLVPEFVKKGYRFFAGAPEIKAAAEVAPEVAEATKHLDYLGRSIEALKQAGFKTVKELPKGAVAGAAVGGTAGGAGGALETRTEETAEQRQEARWEEIKHGFETGTMFGTVIGAGGSALGLLGEFGKKAWGQMTLSEQRAAVKQAEDAIEKLRGSLQTDVGRLRSKEEVRLKAMEAAKELQLTEEQAQAFVKSAQERVDITTQEMQNIVNDFKSLPTKNQKDFGGYLKERLEGLKGTLEKNREKEAKFAESLASAPEGKVVDVNPVVSYIDKEIADYLEGSPTRNMLQNIKDSLVGKPKKGAPTAGEAAGEILEAAETGGVPEKGISIKTANNARKEWNLMRSQRDLKALTGVDAVSQDQLRHLEKITDLLNDSAGLAHKPYMESVRMHRALSRPLDIFRTGAFSELGAADALSGENVKLGADVLRGVLAEARKGDPAFAELIKNDPEFKQLAKEYFTGELFGVDLNKRNITPTTFPNFWKKNQQVLDDLGLTQDFLEMQKRFESGKGVLEEAKTTLKEKEAKAAEVSKTTKEAARDIEKTQDLQRSLNQLEVEIKNTAPENVGEKFDSWAKKLVEKEVIDVSTYDSLLAQMEQAQAELKQTQDVLKFAEKVRMVLGGLGFATVAGSALTPYGVGSFAHKSARGGE